MLVASVLGSLHCAGMCGGLALFAVGAGGEGRRRVPLHIAYHGGRGIGYTLVGLLAGGLGSVVDLGGELAGIQRAAAVAAGSAMVVFGLAALARELGVRLRAVRLPGFYQRLVERLHRVALALPAGRRAWAVGLLTPALPCGWLYAFAIVAAATGNPGWGALAMVSFWLGTLPVMVTVAAGMQALAGPLRTRIPTITALLVVVIGAFTIAGRVALPTFVPEDTAQAQPDSIRAAIEQVSGIDPDDLPCCGPDGLPIEPTAERATP